MDFLQGSNLDMKISLEQTQKEQTETVPNL